MEVGDYVQIKSGGVDLVYILEGVPYRKAYVDVSPGADAGYVYLRMYDQHLGDKVTMPLNIYDVEDLKVITGDEYNKIITKVKQFDPR